MLIDKRNRNNLREIPLECETGYTTKLLAYRGGGIRQLNQEDIEVERLI